MYFYITSSPLGIVNGLFLNYECMCTRNRFAVVHLCVDCLSCGYRTKSSCSSSFFLFLPCRSFSFHARRGLNKKHKKKRNWTGFFCVFSFSSFCMSRPTMSPVKKKTTIFFFDRYFLDRCYIMLFLFLSLSLLCYHSQARVTPFGGRDHYRSAIEQNAKPSTKVTTTKKTKTF